MLEREPYMLHRVDAGFGCSKYQLHNYSLTPGHAAVLSFLVASNQLPNMDK